MKLSPRDRTILAVCQVWGDESIQRIARESGTREHIARRVIADALERGLLVRRVLVNLFDLGLHQYVMRLSSGALTTAERSKVRAALVKAPYIELLLELSALSDLLAVVTVRSILDLENLLSVIAAETGLALGRVDMHIRVGWHYFGAKYLNPKVPIPPLVVAPTKQQISLSKEQAQLLSAYASHPTGKFSEIARATGRPLSSVQYQIERLKSQGIILGTRYQLAPAAIGHQAFRVFVNVNAPQKAHRQAILKWAQSAPTVVTAMYGVGRWQYEFRIEASDYDEAKQVTDGLTERHPRVISDIEVVPVSKVARMQLYPDQSLFDLNSTGDDD